jgi:hypothetical protein
MKFNWGTGIFIVLVLFLAACAVFIVFALRQEVNLVHKDYYEKGVDYTEQMNVNERSKSFDKDIQVVLDEKFLQVGFNPSLVSRIDSGKVHLYRPSNFNLDAFYTMEFSENKVLIPKNDLVSGRYLLKISWYSEGLKYEVEKPVDIR